MLFQKDIEPCCAYCQRGTQLQEDAVLCAKRGVVRPGDHCARFKYDPLKRTPPFPLSPDFTRLKDEDFAL